MRVYREQFANSEPLLPVCSLLADNRQDCPRIRFADHQGLLCEGLFVSQRCYRIDAHG
jgi:hypothetical protein